LIVFFKQPYRPIVTVGDFRNDLIRDLVTEMFNTRLGEIVQEADAPFIHAGQGYGPLVRQVYVNQLYALAKEGRTAEALTSLLTECYRVTRHGFLESELERAKQSLLTNYEIDASEADKTPSNRLATRYVSNFLYQMPVISSADCYKLAKRLLPGISVEEVTAAARAGITDHNMVIALTAPEKGNVAVPTEADLLALYTAAKNDTAVAPYEDRFSDEPLVVLPARAASGAEILGEDAHGITQVKLSNGLVVHLKPTTFKNDEILLGAYNLGGTSLVELPDLISATMAGAIQSQSGLGAFDNTELNKKLQGHTVTYQAGLDDLHAVINGSSTVKDLELLLQINYLTFTAPRQDRRACRSLVSKLKTRYRLLKASPNYVFSDSLLRAASNHDPRYNFLYSEAQLDQIDADRVYDIFREQFGNAGSFRFYLVGSFNIDDNLLSLLETYLGSLPARTEERHWRDCYAPFPSVKTEFEMAMGADDQSMVGLVFSMPYNWDLPTRQSLSFFSDLMEIKLLEKIREEMGGVYS
ncbi:MAG: insulinase family protein, partial [Bacteroidales bacterium]|nr:insulinase family protein [Bacteroidales bacterium]